MTQDGPSKLPSPVAAEGTRAATRVTAETTATQAEPGKPRLLVVALDTDLLESVTRSCGSMAEIIQCSLLDHADVLAEAAKDANLICVQWDGPWKRAHALVTGDRKLGLAGKPLYMLVPSDVRDLPQLSPRQSRLMGITGWIEIPARYFELQRLLHDIRPAQDEADGASRQPEVAEGAGPTIRPLLRRTTSKGTPAALAAAVLKRLGAGPSAEAGAQAGRPERKGETVARKPPGGYESVVVFHPDPAFGDELRRLVQESGVPTVHFVTETREFSQVVSEYRPHAAVLWLDQALPQSTVLLRNMLAAHDEAPVPTLLLVPGREVIVQFGREHPDLIVDAVAVFERSAGRMAAALAQLRANASDPASAKGMLERLRAPFRQEGAASGRRHLTLDEAVQTAETLAAQPGKAVWALAALIPHCLAHKNPELARETLRRLEAAAPVSCQTALMRAAIAARAPESRATGALALVSEAVTADWFNDDCGLRIGHLLNRWGELEALAALVDQWPAGNESVTQPALAYLAAVHERRRGRLTAAGDWLAAAVTVEPWRGLFQMELIDQLMLTGQNDQAVELLRLGLKRRHLPEAARLKLVEAELGRGRYRDAAHELRTAAATGRFRAADLERLESRLPSALRAKAQ